MVHSGGYHAVQPTMHPHIPSQTFETLASYTSSAYMTPSTAHEAQFQTMPTTTISNHAMASYPGYTSEAVPAQSRQEPDGTYMPSLHRANSLDSSWNRTQAEVNNLRQGSLDSAWHSDSGISPSAESLAEAMGGLKIDHMAIGEKPLNIISWQS